MAAELLSLVFKTKLLDLLIPLKLKFRVKIETLKFVHENYAVHKLLFFQKTLRHKDLREKNNICRQLKYHQNMISEIGISLEIILNVVKYLAISLVQLKSLL